MLVMCNFPRVFIKEYSEHYVLLPATFISTQTLRLLTVKFLGDIRSYIQFLSWILCTVCVTCNENLKQSFQRSSVR